MGNERDTTSKRQKSNREIPPKKKISHFPKMHPSWEGTKQGGGGGVFRRLLKPNTESCNVTVSGSFLFSTVLLFATKDVLFS